MEYKFLKQKRINDCGVATSAMLINSLHNKNLTIEEIKFENAIADSELSFYNIEVLLEKYNIEFKTYQATHQEFLDFEFNTPLIASVMNDENLQHYVVIYKKTKKAFLVADPSKNDMKWIDKNEFIKKFNGYFGIAVKFKKYQFKTNSFMKWWYFLQDQVVLISIFFVVSFLCNIIILVSNTFIKVYSKNLMIVDKSNLQYIFLAFILIFIVQIFISSIIEKLIFNIRSSIAKKMFEMFSEKLISIEYEKYSALKKEEWSKKIMHIGSLSQFIVNSTLLVPSQFLLFVMSLVMLTFISNVILLLVILENILTIFFSYISYTFIKEKQVKKLSDSIKFSVIFRELLDGNFEIRTKNLEKVFNVKVANGFNDNFENENQINNIQSINEVIVKVLSRLFYLLIFYLSANFILAKKFDFNELLFYISISMYISSFSQTIFSLILNRQEIKLSMNELEFILDEKKLNKEEIVKVEKIKSIQIKNLYKYKNENRVVSDINFEFKKNTFIYGKSGSGKTSLLQLLTGYVNEYEGSIKINEIDFKKVDKRDYREKVLFIGQYDYLFNGTVWSNIQQFKNTIDLELFKKLRFFEVLASNNIEVEKEIIDNGTNLSKGQRQIINFMSAFFTQKDIYLIDEPLSNVDRATAYYLIDQFIQLKKNSIILMSDHNSHYQQFFEDKLEVLNEKC